MESNMSFLPIIILLIIILLNGRKEQQIIKRIVSKKKGQKKTMTDLAKNFIGKRCLIYTFNSQVTGTIKEVTDSGILLEEKGELQIVNPDYIVRIREYPKNKKGKDKSVILD